MAQKWFQKATVQQAIIGGACLVVCALITGFFALSSRQGESDMAASDLSTVIVTHRPEWSDTEKEVWQRVDYYWRSLYKKSPDWGEELFHEDFSIWGNRTAEPIGKREFINGVKVEFSATTYLFYSIYPRRVTVFQDTAIVHYTFDMLFASGADATQRRRQARATMILRNEAGTWLITAIHTTDIPLTYRSN